jgi:uncharacterized peroxidase-related enzyme
MAFFKSLPDGAGPANVFTAYPEIYRLWSQMSQALMNGPSPLTQGERELILAYAAGIAGCRFVYAAHSEVAYAWGFEAGTLDRLLEDPVTAPVDARLKPLLAFVRKLILTPGEMSQADADAVFAAGWDEKALHDAIAVTARAAFMQRLVEGPKRRVERGYVNLYPAFRDDK